jgi:hypothetical protein
MVETEAITRRFHLLAGLLDERARRLVAAAEALSIGRGGSIAVARAEKAADARKRSTRTPVYVTTWNA